VVFVSANVKLNTGVIERLEQWSDALVATMMLSGKWEKRRRMILR